MKGFVMAEKVGPPEEVLRDTLKRAWIVRSLNAQRAMLVRSRQKELFASDIYQLRTREIEFIDSLIKEYS